ncbi:MAG: hypothetical protein ABIJ21_03400 [Nanoarchaeota archaeon]
MGGLQELVQKTWRNAKRDGGLLLSSVLVFGALSCSESTKPENVVTSVPVWKPLLAQSIPEDSPDGSVIYQDIKERAIFDGQVTYTVGTNIAFSAYVQGNDVRVRNMLRDSNGVDTVRVYANGVEGKFLLSVTPVDDPSEWQELFPQSIPENAGNGVIIYQNIDERLSDPDSPKNISVTGANEHFEAYYEGGHVKIRNLVPNWFGEEDVHVLGNGIENQFTLTVAGQDTPTTWSTVPNVFCDEDDTLGKILLNTVSGYVHDPDTPAVIDQVYSLDAEVRLKVVDDKLVVDYLQPDWNGMKTFRLRANGVESNDISLQVNAVDDPAVWEVIEDVSVFAPAQSTVIIWNIYDLVDDIDSPEEIRIVSDHQGYNLKIVREDLIIEDVVEGVRSLQDVILDCNGIQTRFALEVIPQYEFLAEKRYDNVLNDRIYFFEAYHDYLFIGSPEKSITISGSSLDMVWQVPYFFQDGAADDEKIGMIMADIGGGRTLLRFYDANTLNMEKEIVLNPDYFSYGDDIAFNRDQILIHRAYASDVYVFPYASPADTTHFTVRHPITHEPLDIDDIVSVNNRFYVAARDSWEGPNEYILWYYFPDFNYQDYIVIPELFDEHYVPRLEYSSGRMILQGRNIGAFFQGLSLANPVFIENQRRVYDEGVSLGYEYFTQVTYSGINVYDMWSGEEAFSIPDRDDGFFTVCTFSRNDVLYVCAEDYRNPPQYFVIKKYQLNTE